jgi:hypothetical protein
MDFIVLENVKPYDGRYEFDLAGSELTTREWGWIKRHSGYLPLTVEEGFTGADPELFAVFATIALRRSGRIESGDVPAVYDRLVDAPFGSTIRMETDTATEQGDDADPPPTGEKPSSSGNGSDESSETSAGPRNGSGIRGSGSSPLPPGTRPGSQRDRSTTSRSRSRPTPARTTKPSRPARTCC